MKSIFLITILFLFILAGCGKDKFESNPHLEVKSVSTKEIPVNGSLSIRLEFTDKEGDVYGSLYIYKTRINAITTPTVRDIIMEPIPTFPNSPKGEIEVTLDYQNHLISAREPYRNPLTNRNEPDTLNLSFIVKDKAGNSSDTAKINNVVVIR